MKTRFLTTLSLLAVLLASCAPATSVQGDMPAKTQIPGDRVDIAAFATQTAIAEANTPSQSTGSLEPTLTPVVGGMHAVEAAATQTALAPTPIPIVTSRGPHLEASDPKTVSMASGGLQFVEFFEFW